MKFLLTGKEDDAKLSAVVDTLEGRDAIQRDLDRFERWTCVNLCEVPEVQVLYLTEGNPKHGYRLGKEQIESSLEQKDSGILVNENLNTSLQCTLAVQKAKCILDCIKSSMVIRSGNVILHLYSFSETPPGFLHSALEPPA
ncbi:rna-directed dna polymerase from mobile element jockey-like [Pitangus sulphuratus]|nr:rna-directed dna polymerase from mobile element jockey-like [Pitangus sulphuratus]